jgi:hypothetical protein
MVPLVIHSGLQEVCSELCDTGRPIVDLQRTFPLLIKELNTFEQTFGDIQWRDKLNSESFYSLKALFQLHNQLIDIKNG